MAVREEQLRTRLWQGCQVTEPAYVGDTSLKEHRLRLTDSDPMDRVPYPGGGSSSLSQDGFSAQCRQDNQRATAFLSSTRLPKDCRATLQRPQLPEQPCA